MLTVEEKKLIQTLKYTTAPIEWDAAAITLISIIERLEAERPKIAEFSMEFRWLSNFEHAWVEFDGIWYRSVEHAYQAAKTLDLDERIPFTAGITSGAAKRLGSKVTLRPNWTEEVRIAIMTDLNRQKYEIPKFRDKLIATGNMEIIEGNTWGDTFWGVCNGVGRNELGKILMKIRTELVGKS